jgi:ABC-type multidrug transport system fused ATPase/permease subunit/glycosyltransferase involved in cell wall biosynthesis
MAQTGPRGARVHRPMKRVRADGKHLALEGLARPFRIRGVTYGTFSSRSDGCLFPEPWRIDADFRAMRTLGLNTVRVYTVPPEDLLQSAERCGLRVLVGLDYHDWQAEPHTGRLAERRILDAGRRRVEEAMDVCSGRPAVLGVAVGNEIPNDLVRMHGISSVERVLAKMIADVHEADDELLATYVNYPTTEFLEVEGQDLASYNVFLEDEQAFRSYLQHLMVVSGEVPLLVSEMGLASAIHGEHAQAESLSLQLRAVDEVGCVGATIFSWTDEWAVADSPVEGWGFGITRLDRSDKPAVREVESWAGSKSPRHLRSSWPSISVIVCAYNEERTIGECLSSLQGCDYPELEVIVVDDGSTDRTAEIATGFPFRILTLDHGGLSGARNAGIDASSSEIIAFLDADAVCHSEWLYHLALSLEEEGVVATGGPNPPFEDVDSTERSVALSPGRPMEVLISDNRAEHVPGCNMAYESWALREVGGFDVAYRSAGDDVDVCWKLLDSGHEIAFSSAAQVRHHRRDTVRGYLKQQRGYGAAERMLSGAHPHRFNGLGQARWTGFLYGGPRLLPRILRPVIYHGYLGNAPFQKVERRRAESVGTLISALLPLTLVPFIIGLLLSFVSMWWLSLSGGVVLLLVGYGFSAATTARLRRGEPRPLKVRTLVGWLHVAQPFARTWGRIAGSRNGANPEPVAQWVGSRSMWLASVQRGLQRMRCAVRAARPGVPWDLEVRIGLFIRATLTVAIAWRWEPRSRVRHRPTVLFWLALLGAASTAWFSPQLALIALVVVVSVSTVERLILARRIDRVLRMTSATAREPRGYVAGRGDRVHVWKVLRPYSLRQWRWLLVILLLTAVLAVMSALQPLPMKILIDNALGRVPPGGMIDTALGFAGLESSQWVLVLVAASASVIVGLVFSLAAVALDRSWEVAGQRMVYSLAADLFHKLQRLPLAFHRDRATGDLLSRLTTDSWSVYTLTDALMISPLVQVVTMGVVGYAAWQLDPYLAVVCFLLVPPIVLSARYLGRSLERRTTTNLEAKADIVTFVHRVLGAIPLVQVYNAQERNRRRLADLAGKSVRAVQRASLFESMLSSVGGLVMAIGSAVVFFLGSIRISAGTITLGTLLVFVAYLEVLRRTGDNLLKLYARARTAKAGLRRVVEVLEFEEGVRDPVSPVDLPGLVSGGGRGVGFEGVVFGYEEGERVLDGIDLAVDAGETVALVGRTGVGKTTLVSLIPRFFDPWEGRVVMDGVDLRDLRLEEVRAQVGLVRQDPLLLPISVGENIAYGRPDASFEEVRAAAEAANAAEFIDRLPGGYDTVLVEQGASLSGGQRQRLAIARALLKDAPILVLDEPTAALDAETESLLVEALERLMQDRTTFVIAHRLSTVRHADRIVVLDQGRIVETGSHHDLLNRQGQYHHLQMATQAEVGVP